MRIAKKRKQKLKQIISLILCFCVLLPAGGMFAFAENKTETVETAPVENTTEAVEKEGAEEEQKTQETKPAAEEKEQDKDRQKTDSSKEKPQKEGFTLKAEGNGNVIVKLAAEPDEALVSMQEENKTFNYSVGDKVYIKTYAVDGNKTSFSKEKGVKLVSKEKYVLSEERIYQIIDPNAALTVSFTGGEKEGASKQSFATKRAAARAAASMSTSVSVVKYQYGYESDGSQSKDNKYAKFNATGAYNNAAYCAEHSRNMTATHITGSVMTDSTLRKILYYGYRGPKQWSGFASSTYNGAYTLWGDNTNRTEICGTCVTAQALSDRYRSFGGKGIAANPSGLSAFMAYVNSQPDPGSSWTLYRAKASGQDMMWGVYEPNGKLTMTKEVAENEGIVNECPEMYTLEGAEYTVKNSSDKVVGTLKIDKNGKANTLELPVGTYKVKETKAPNGFAMDNKTYTVNVTSNQTATFTSKEVPLFDPVTIFLEKIAEDGKGSYVNKNADMSNAEFTIKYYDSIDGDVSKLEPIRTWKLKTIERNGKYTAQLRKECLIEGSDEFFLIDGGVPVLPRGQITIQETKAPIGYKVDPKIYKYKIEKDSTDKLVKLNFGNTPEQPNTPLTPKISTTAADIHTKDNVGSFGENIVIEDNVAFKELVPNKIYTIKGKLMDKKTGEPLLIDGKEITAEKTFTVVDKDYQGVLPDGEIVKATVNGKGASGEVTLTYELNKTDLAGVTTVVFEKLFHNGKEIATHEDLKDEKQTIQFPEVKTTATSETTGTNLGMPSKEEKLIDKVDCKNLIVGKEYTIKGKLMNKGTGEPLIIDGKEVTAEKTFTATEKNMVVELVFTYDSSKLQGETVVVFEDMYHNGILVGSHADLEDSDQTITYPDMGTTAWISSAGKRVKPVTIVDKVSYTNLQPEKEYTIKGKLMDKKTGEPFLTKEGKEVTSEKTFVPKEKDGFVEMTYTLGAKDIEGKSVVVFEDMFFEEELIMTHSDITDKNQTVAVGRLDVWFDKDQKGKPMVNPTTGDDSNISLFIGLFAVASLMLIALFYRKKKNDKTQNQSSKQV